MKPTVKSEAIEDAIEGIFGHDRREGIYANKCAPKPIGCGREVVPELWDALSQKEFSISGLCANCQDGIFDDKSNLFDEIDPLTGRTPREREYYTPTDNDFVIERQPMICGSAEAESRRYHKYIGKGGRIWLVADQEDATANVYVEGGPGSDGFGGRTLTFPLVDGTEIKLKGPWHANFDGLLAETGVDIRDRHYTFVVVSRDRKSGKNYESIMVDVLYRDDEPQLGSFHRGDEIARQWARELGVPVYCYSQSKGGSSCGQVKPDQVFYWEKKDSKPSTTTAAQDAIIRS